MPELPICAYCGTVVDATAARSTLGGVEELTIAVRELMRRGQGQPLRLSLPPHDRRR